MERIRLHETFNSFQEFSDCMNAYAEENHIVLTKNDTKLLKGDERLVYKYLVMACKHYGQKKANKKLKHERVHQKSFKTNCGLHVCVKADNGLLKISRLELNHNDATSAAILKHYPKKRKLSDTEIQESLATKLLDINVSSPQLRTYFQKMTGKHVTYQDVCNLRHKIKAERAGGLTDTEQALAELIKLLDDDPEAVVIIGKQSLEDGTTTFIDLRSVVSAEEVSLEGGQEKAMVTLIFFQSGEMRGTYKEFPEIIFMDTTYNVTQNKMPLSVVMVVDGYGVGRPVSYCFLAEEGADTYAATLTCLKQSCPEAAPKTNLITVDKDPSEIAAGEKVFPWATIQICEFHTLKSFRSITSTIGDKDVRNLTREKMQTLVYADTEDKFREALDDFKSVAPRDIELYLEVSWIKQTLAWSRFQKLIIPNFGNNTTNILESYNRCIKGLASKTCSMAQSVKAILQVHSNRMDRVEDLKFASALKTSYRTDTDDPAVTEIWSRFTPFAARILDQQISQMGEADAADNETTCDCPHFKAFRLP